MRKMHEMVRVSEFQMLVTFWILPLENFSRRFLEESLGSTRLINYPYIFTCFAAARELLSDLLERDTPSSILFCMHIAKLNSWNKSGISELERYFVFWVIKCYIFFLAGWVMFQRLILKSIFNVIKKFLIQLSLQSTAVSFIELGISNYLWTTYIAKISNGMKP